MDLTVSEMSSTWKRVLGKVKESVDDPLVYDTFFGDSYIDSVHGDTMLVIANSKFASQILASKYLDLVTNCVYEVTETNYKVNFSTPDAVKEEARPEKVTRTGYFSDSYLNQSFTFSTFVTGPCNLEAFQAAVLASENPGKFYNPILIYGDSGLGKTHLLHAIGNAIRLKVPSMKVLYVHAQEFLNEYVKYVNGDRGNVSIIDWFKSSVDVLLVDDVQFLVNKPKTEETFFSIYESFYAANKQIVITSDVHPKNLNGLDERLKTRFVQGLPLSISAPDKATCEAILKRRIEANGLSVDDFEPSVISYFASRFNKNVRELEGAFDRLLFYTINIRPTKYVDLDIAMDSVQTLVDVETEKTRLSGEKILDVVSSYYGLTTYQLTGRIRTSQIALPRHIAMYLCRSLLNMPYTKIGDLFGGKDHATVMNAVSKVEKSLTTDKGVQKAINDLTNRLKA